MVARLRAYVFFFYETFSLYTYVCVYIYIFFIHISLQTGNDQTMGPRNRAAREHRALPHIKSRERLDRALPLICLLSNNKMSLSYALRATYATEKSRIPYFYL